MTIDDLAPDHPNAPEDAEAIEKYPALMAEVLYRMCVRMEVRTDALRLILPMAKGYAAEHPVGNNAQFVRQAEEALAMYNECPDCGHVGTGGGICASCAGVVGGET